MLPAWSLQTPGRHRGGQPQQGVRDRRAAVRALDAVTAEFADAQFTAIMGPSGSGKSTLLHCLAGLDTPTSGQVFLGDMELGALSDTQLTRLRRDQVGFIFQSFNLLPALTVAENIALPLLLAGRKPAQAWLDDVVSLVGLGDRLGHRPSELSGGQQQRVAVARALASQPEIIFADEPTGNLDSRAVRPAARLPAHARSASSARPSSWSPTTRPPPPCPTRCCSWPTAGSPAGWTGRPPTRYSTGCGHSAGRDCDAGHHGQGGLGAGNAAWPGS